MPCARKWFAGLNFFFFGGGGGEIQHFLQCVHSAVWEAKYYTEAGF